MTDTKAETAGKTAVTAATQVPRTIVPFTGGLVIFLYAFFWPESYGRWLGTIVHAFRQAAGL